MPKVKQNDWQDQSITDAQKIKLLVMLREAEEIEVERGTPLEEYEGEAVGWVNGHLSHDIDSLDDLTKGEIQELFEILR